MRCVAPPAAAERGAVPLRVLDGDAVCGGAAAFVYRVAGAVHRVHPLAGGLGGGTLLAVSGSGYGGGGGGGGAGLGTTASAARCRIGDASVPARRAAAGVLACATPRARAPGYVAVEVAADGHEFTSGGAHFEYQRAHRVRALAPSSGPAEGGALVRVAGHGFARRAAVLGYLACRFNRSSAAAAWRGAAEVRCIAPAHAAGVVGVELTQNAQQHTGDGALFEYARALAHSVRPSAGPPRGGTLVEVRGAGFGARGGGARALHCQFGAGAAVRATRASGVLVRCVAPPAAAERGAVPLRVLDGDAVCGGAAAFVYRVAGAVHRVHPLAGGLGGGTLLAVSGSGFGGGGGGGGAGLGTTASAARCRIGDASVPARRAAAGVLACATPRARAPGYVAVEVAADGHEFTSGGAHFEYQRAHRVRALAPSSGPAEGGALVRVAGHGFARRAAVLGYLACRFNRSSAAAAWRGAAEVRCIAPAHAAGVVGVELTQNAQQHTGDGALFEYARALAHSVRPSAGPPRGGTLVEVRGAGFGARGGGARALHCQFGAGAAVRATRASGVLVRCVAPPAAAERGAVPLRVLDGDAVCGGAAAFVYRVAGAVHRVHPLAGGLGGGTLLAVSGSGFGGGGGGGGAGLGTTASAARCRIGDASVPARRAAAGVLACATRARARLGTLLSRWRPMGTSSRRAVRTLSTSARTVSARSRRAAGRRRAVRSSASLGTASRGALPCSGTSRAASTGALRRRRGVARRRCAASRLRTRRASSASSSRRMRSSTRVTARSSSTRARSRTACARALARRAAARSSRCVARALARARGGARALHCQFGAGAAVRATRASGVLVRCVAPPAAAERGAVPLRVLDGDAVCGGAAAFVYRVAGAVHRVHPLAGGLGGGTLLAVSGSGFGGGGGGGGAGLGTTASAARCRIGDASVPARRAAAGVLACATPRARAPGYVAVEVAADGHEFTSGGAHFEYQRAHRVRALAPSSGPAEGGALVRVAGHGFARRAAVLGYLACRFNRSSAAAAWRGAAEVRCIAPAHAAGVVGVELTQNAQQHTGDGALFEYARALAHSVRPSAGPPRGGTLVEVRGAGFGARGGGARALHCQFGAGAAVRATRASGVLVRCVAPPAAAERGAVPLRVLDGDAVCGGAAAFVYRVAGAVHRVHPLAGGLGGGTLLAVSGSGFGGGGGGGGAGLGTTASAARCRIGDASVPARRAAAGVLACATPRARAPGYVAVEVAADGHEFTSGGAHFEYQRAHRVRALAPSSGPAEGGALVRVAGHGFARRAAVLGYLACRFNRSSAAAAWRGAAEVRCIAPAHAAGVVGVELTQNAQQHTGDGALFEYARALAHSVRPSAGPPRGGTLVEVRGAGFGARGGGARALHCQFGAGAAVRATRASGVLVRCVAPPAAAERGAVPLRVLDGDAVCGGAAAFVYRVAGAVHRVHPLAGGLGGGTLLAVSGSGFGGGGGGGGGAGLGTTASAARCRIGDASVPARRAAAGVLACATPRARAPGYVAVEVAADGHEFTSGGAHFEYQRAHRVRALAPSSGPAEGGALVRVAGHGFARRAAVLGYLACRFNRSSAAAAWRGAAEVRCIAPAHAAGVVGVELTQNAQQHTGDGALFEYARALAHSVRPSAGPPRGGTLVEVRGAGFGARGGGARALHCQFGAGAAVRATRASGVLVRCVAPPAAAERGAVPLRVLDGDAVCGGAAAFVYRVAGAVHRVHPLAGGLGGGTLLAVSGSGFGGGGGGGGGAGLGTTASAARCRIGDASVPARRAAAGVLACATPRARAPGYVAVEVAADGHEFTSGGAHFEYQRAHRVRALAPSSGPAEGGALVRVAGHGFARRAAVLGYLACRFNRSSAAAAWRGAAEVRCIAPAHAAGVVGVELTQNAQQHTGDGALFEYARALAHSVRPSAGPPRGGTLVEVRGAGFGARGGGARALHCQFGAGAAVRATRASGVLVRCVAPPAAAERGAVPLRVLDGDAVCGGAAAFVYRVAGAVHRVHPLAGGLGGGTLLAVSGSGFGGGGGGGGGAGLGTTASAARCRIGDASVPARRAAAGVLACATPRARAPGYVAVEVAADGHEFTSGGAHFEYQRAHRVRALAPSSGPAEGGALVRVAGHGFARRAAVLGYLACRFNRSSAAAAWRGAAEVRCIAPAHAAGVVGVELTQNAQQHTGDGALFEYARALAHSVRPSAGPPRGGTLVEVRGAGFGARGGGARALHCQFGAGAAVRATRASGVLVRCVAPPAAAERGAVPLRVLDGDAVCGGAAAFVYRVAGAVHRVHPLAGGLGGGTLLAVSGSGFGGGGGGGGGAGLGTTASAARCRIGDASVPARRAAAGVLACATPRARAPGYVAVEVAADGHEFTSGGAHFEYQRAHRVRALAPSSGPAEGGALVRVAGHGFARRAAVLGYLACRFNRSSAAAAWRGAAEVRCIAPAHAAGVVGVELTQNAQQHTGDGALFEYARALAHSVRPSAGPPRGGTLVEVRGAGFGARGGGARALHCQFGAGAAVRATRASGVLVRCVAPPAAAERGAVPLRVLDGDAVCGGAAAFVYRVAGAVHRVHPLAGGLGGGTLLAVSGSGFGGGGGGGGAGLGTTASAARCRIGDASVPARRAAAGVLACATPRARTPGYVAVEVAADGHEFTSGGAHFEYQRAHRVRALAPSSGPAEGGALVRVAGHGFARRAAVLGYLACRFNRSSAAAAWRGAAEVRCIAPAHAAGVVGVELTQNAQQHTGDGALFEYARALAHSVRPSAGPPRGGTLVEVRGAGFGARGGGARALHCQFGAGAAVRATRASGVLVRCVAPPAAAERGAVPLRVLDGDAVCGGAAAFVYRVAGAVHRVHPLAGGLGGGTLLAVSGGGGGGGAVEPASARRRRRHGAASATRRCRRGARRRACSRARRRARARLGTLLSRWRPMGTSSRRAVRTLSTSARTVSARSRRAAGRRRAVRSSASLGTASRGALPCSGTSRAASTGALRRRRGVARRRCAASRLRTRRVSSASSSRRMRSSTRVTARSSSTRARSRTACARALARRAAARSSRCVARALARAAAAHARCTASLARVRRCARLARVVCSCAASRRPPPRSAGRYRCACSTATRCVAARRRSCTAWRARCTACTPSRADSAAARSSPSLARALAAAAAAAAEPASARRRRRHGAASATRRCRRARGGGRARVRDARARARLGTLLSRWRPMGTSSRRAVRTLSTSSFPRFMPLFQRRAQVLVVFLSLYMAAPFPAVLCCLARSLVHSIGASLVRCSQLPLSSTAGPPRLPSA